jgi:chromate transporter
MTPLSELIVLFLRLGFTAFGGPAAHIALFHDEVVKRRQWLTDEQFMDMLGAVNLIPGPNSTEMAIHIGYERAGWRGLVAAGVCFILPAALIVGALAALYVQFGTTPAAESLLYGIKPVVIAIVGQAIWGLAGKALKNRLLWATGATVFVLALLGAGEIPLLFGAGLAVMLIAALRDRLPAEAGGAGLWAMLPLLAQAGAAAVPVSLGVLFLTFLKIGATLYGSGYVLLAFLQTEFVNRLGWLTQQQILDAVAVGQFTPGPVFTTATFIGYVILGVPGAVVATLGIFLPSFVFVWATKPLIGRLRRSRWLSAFLDGVNAAALALMAAVTLTLGRAALVDTLTVALALASGVLLIRWRVNSTWLIVGGALVGLTRAAAVG